MDGGKTVYIGGRKKIEDLERLEDWQSTSGIALWSLILLGGLILNSTLLLAFLKRPGLRTISNRFVMNLTISNVITCCVLNILLMLDGPVSHSKPCMCAVAEGATALVTTSSVFSVLLIALDQYLAVVDPLRYRTRIDTLKCGILVASVWIISLTLSLIAALNPNPKSIWLTCQPSVNSVALNSSEKIDETRSIDQQINVDESNISMTYGLIYTLAFSLFGYLLPFVGVCWIYIRIYTAAHNNSKRTRRTGSRPILSTGSFSDEYYPVRQDLSHEDFRRITKISSLSSIDESTESSPSHIPRRFSEFGNHPSPIQEEPSTVIFTVGSKKVDVTGRQSNDDDTKEPNRRVPISVLRAQFLNKRNDENTDESLVKSKFQDGPEQQRKSSHDLMCEEIMKRDLEMFRLGHFNAQSDSSDGDYEEDEERGVIFENILDVKGSTPRVQDENLIEGNSPNVHHSSLIKNNDSMNIQTAAQKNVKNTTSLPACDPRQISKNKSQPVNVKQRDDSIHEDQAYSKLSLGNLEANCIVNPTPIVTITPPHRPSLHRVSSTKSTSSYINSLKYRISNGSLFKYREETRAARVSAFVIVMSLICWTPYFIVLILKNLPCYLVDYVPHEIDIVAINLFISTAYISPMLFGYRSKRVKRELQKLFCFRRELSYQNNRSLMAKKVLKRRHSGNLSNFEVDNKCNIFHCVYGKNKWPKEKVQFIQVPETALIVETCRSSFSSGASTQVSSTSTDDC
ncbi:uncharacterized protein [Fopius arisanus]|uniref:HRH2_0 protein n=1 Tax=Fopius arisanus TaxID=64838 RepID=A0A0C9R7X2_9HYME|nr:PREDICTED: uncharacterized protein LOC105263906 [Fopius arisanus]